ncbi:MAG: hypothetical protein LBC35_03530 [Coriobacteriales bacterium]|nr:hypothetical protein [Coriobacteriales bacterium]
MVVVTVPVITATPAKLEQAELERILIPGLPAHIRSNYMSLSQRAATTGFSMLEPEFVILDTETTGFDPTHDALIEIAAAIVRGAEVIERFSTFVNPKRPIPPQISEITAIYDADVEDAPTVEVAIAQLVDFCGERPIIAHNAAFDQAFIRANLPTIDTSSITGSAAQCAPLLNTSPWIDTVELARIALPLLKEYNLETLSAVFAPDARSTHRAIDDVEALAVIWRVILVALSDLPPGLCGFLAGMYPDEDWASRQALCMVATYQAALAQGTEQHFSLKKARAALTVSLKQNNKVDARELVEELGPEPGPSARTEPEPGARTGSGAGARPEAGQEAESQDDACGLQTLDMSELCEHYSARGLMGTMYPDYERRDEQLTMATEVVRALNTSDISVIEAGTGVGKSMAYLLPLALFSKRNPITCGVATKTNALLDQIIYHELPRLNTALAQAGLGELQYLSLKGYSHYPCLRKLQKAARKQEPYSGEAALVSRLLAYVCQSLTGDLDALPLHWADVPRFELVASAEDCLSYRCSYYHSCLLHSMRRQAKNADIIVTNHSLLFKDTQAGRAILPPVRHWVIDEAHGAEQEARSQLSLEVGFKALDETLSALSRSGGLLPAMLRVAQGLEGSEMLEALIHKALVLTRPLDNVADSFFSYVKELCELTEGSDYHQVELWIDTRVRESPQWGQVTSSGQSLERKLSDIVHHLKNLITAADDCSELMELSSTLAGLTAKLTNDAATLALILDGSDTRYVYAALLDRREKQRIDKLLAYYYNVGEVLLQDFYPELASVIYTSATIALGKGDSDPSAPTPPSAPTLLPIPTPSAAPPDAEVESVDAGEPLGMRELTAAVPQHQTARADFAYFLRGVGLDHLPKEQVHTLKLGSSYDFDANMTVFVPTDIPEPNNLSLRHLYIEALEKLLFEVHTAMGGSVLTLFTNRRDMEDMFNRLKDRLANEHIDLLCQYRATSKTRLRERFIANEQLSLFALRSFWEGFDAPGRTLRCVIIPKLPFGRPNDPLQQERELREKRAWIRYSLPEAIISLKQAAGRLIRSSRDRGYLVLADKRLISKFYGKEFLAVVPSDTIHFLSSGAIAQWMREGRENDE